MRIALMHVVDCSATPGMVPELQRPPAEMYSIAAILRAFKLDAEIVEIYARSRDEMLADVRKVAKKLRPELAGIACQTHNRFDATDAAKAMKEINPKLRVLLHGPHATAMFRQMMDEFPQIDGVAPGEAEGTYLEYAQKMKALSPTAELRGLAQRADDGRVTIGGARRPVGNLDSLPSPGKFFDYAHVLTSRGCPESRGYLPEALVLGDRLRFRSPANVLEELRLLRETYGREVIFFADEDFTASRDHALAICKGIAEGGLKLSFEINSHPNHMCEERLKWLKKSGCFRITYQVESGAEAVLRSLGRPMDIPNAVEMCHLTRKHGIHARFRLILGAPGETAETIEETKRFIEKSRPSSTIVQVMAIYPGTPLYENGRKNGEIDEGVWLKREARILRHWPKELENERDKTVRDFVEFARTHSYPFSEEERAFFNAEYPDTADHFARGRKNLERGNLEEAIAEYELQVQSARDANAAVAGLTELAKCYILIGAYSPALNNLRAADRLLQPNEYSYPKTVTVHPVVTGLMAECYANLREFAECRVVCERLLAAAPEHPYGHYLMSLCLLEGAEPDKARAAAECRKAVELGCKVPPEYLMRVGIEQSAK
jgi:radical SAM superfamily enzyme YgiQ (UPF0313 family)